MRLLLFADVHDDEKALLRLKKKAEKADLAVCAGDFTNFEKGMGRMLRIMNSFGKPVLLVHGNHEDPVRVRRMCAGRKNLVFLHKKVCRMDGFAFVGHGGEGFALESGDFEKFAGKLKFARGEKVVLVTHQPPHGTKLDFIWASHGSRSYRRFIVRRKPVLAVCGHLHETAGMEDRLGRTVLVNPGPKGMFRDV